MSNEHLSYVLRTYIWTLRHIGEQTNRVTDTYLHRHIWTNEQAEDSQTNYRWTDACTSQTHTHTHTDTHTHSWTEKQRYRSTNTWCTCMQIRSHTDAQTHRCTVTQKHRDVQMHSFKHMQESRRTDRQAVMQQHRQAVMLIHWETWIHTDTHRRLDKTQRTNRKWETKRLGRTFMI